MAGSSSGPPDCFKFPPEHQRYALLLRDLRDRLTAEPGFHSCAFFSALFEYALTYGESLVLAGTLKRSVLEEVKGLVARRILRASRRVESEQTN